VNQDAAGSRKKGRLSSRQAKPNYSPQMLRHRSSEAPELKVMAHFGDFWSDASSQV